MRFSDLTQRIAGDGAAAWDIHYRALALREQGEDILLLSVGDPDFDTPQPIVQGAIDSLLNGNTHYAEVRGKRALREAIARRHQQRSGQAVSADQVTVLAGAQCALFSVAQCVLNPGDEVIVAEPMYVTYEAVFGACGAVVVPVPVRSENGFRVLPEDVAARITPRTRALALNSPHNPSGASLPRSTWAALAELCIAHDLWLISDEVYSELLFEGEHVSPASLPGMAERTATLNSLSKSHAMTGWRVGWLVVPPELVRPIERLAQNFFISVPTLSQHAALAAFECRDELDTHVRRYRRNRDLLLAGLPEAGFDRFAPAEGAFYLYCDVAHLTNDSRDFCKRMLAESGVATTPGIDFDRARGAGTLRISFAGSTAEMEEAVRRLKAWRRT